VFENNSGETVNHHHPLDDSKKIVLSKCRGSDGKSKDPDGMFSTALDIIIDRARQSGVTVSSPVKYLESALHRFNFKEGQDREDLMQRKRMVPR
jgi:hypothetical protein